MISGSRLSQFQDHWKNLQAALSSLKKMSARGFLAGGILLWLLFCVGGESAFAQIATDVTVTKDGSSSSTTIATPSFNTAAANELLLAFVSTDYKSGTNTTVKSIAGGSLTWTLVKRTNTQSGTAEIWRAFAAAPLAGVTVTATLSQSVASSITVMSFSGASTTGTNGSGAIGAIGGASASSGAPSASLVTTGIGSWVLGVGNDFDNATARTLGAGQTLVHQYLATAGDTYWVQRLSAPVATAGTTVTIADTAPTKDRYNLSIVEVLATSGVAPTWTLSGSITPASLGAGATVVLSGASSATTAADSNGTYSFTGLANGSYTVTPTKSGVSFSPSNQPVSINGANQSAINFTAQTTVTFAISGSITLASLGAGATVALGGTSSATTTADSNGNYSFTSLANGSYTVTPSKSGVTFSPSNQSVTLNGANQGAINFTAQAGNSLSISGTIGVTGCNGCSYVQSTHSSQSGHTDWPTLLNVKAGHALVYIGEFSNWTPGATVNMTDSHGNTWYRCDNNATSNFPEIQDQTTNGMSCQYALNTAAWPTLTAQPVASQCVNVNCTQVGGSFFELALPATATAEAWATPHAGISTAGSNNVNCGSITLSQANDFLICDFNNASGTPTAGTTPVAFKMQETIVTAIETGLYSGSGTIIPTGTLTSGIAYTGITVAFSATAGGAGATITLSGASSANAVADVNGNYSFTGLANGSYTVTPSKAGYIFGPVNQPVTLNGANQTGVNFTAQSLTSSWSISGTISPVAGGAGATVTLGGSSGATTVADTSGNYSFTGLANGSYTITPSRTQYTFTPASQPVTINGANQSAINFTAQAVAYAISGSITPASLGAGAMVALGGASSATTTADSNGNYSFTGLANGSYTVTPTKSGVSFSPTNQPVTINGANRGAINFTAQTGTYAISGSITPANLGSGATVALAVPLRPRRRLTAMGITASLVLRAVLT